MAEPGAERRLAAIVAIDVAGYSRLMGADEVGTLTTLKAHRTVTDSISEKHGGRIVGTAGDGLLLEFPSVVAAVTFAIETQGVMADRNADIADDLKMLYRVGINLGDVLVDGKEIYGDGVNVAARIEALAEPGGISVSRTVRNQVRDKMDIAFEDLGEVEVKNIARPVRVFRVLREGETAAPAARPKTRPRVVSAAAAALGILIAGGGLWWWQAQPDFEPADPAKMAFALPDKPSIAVLPFDNLSGDPDQEYFADGMANEERRRIERRVASFLGQWDLRCPQTHGTTIRLTPAGHLAVNIQFWTHGLNPAKWSGAYNLKFDLSANKFVSQHGTNDPIELAVIDDNRLRYSRTHAAGTTSAATKTCTAYRK